MLNKPGIKLNQFGSGQATQTIYSTAKGRYFTYLEEWVEVIFKGNNVAPSTAPVPQQAQVVAIIHLFTNLNLASLATLSSFRDEFSYSPKYKADVS